MRRYYDRVPGRAITPSLHEITLSARYGTQTSDIGEYFWHELGFTAHPDRYDFRVGVRPSIGNTRLAKAPYDWFKEFASEAGRLRYITLPDLADTIDDFVERDLFAPGATLYPRDRNNPYRLTRPERTPFRLWQLLPEPPLSYSASAVLSIAKDDPRLRSQTLEELALAFIDVDWFGGWLRRYTVTYDSGSGASPQAQENR